MSRGSADQPLRALIYNRASADPSGRGLSVDAQERENRARCEREGWVVVGVITDNDRSASRFAKKIREGYEQLKQATAGQVFGRVDVLVAVESSRLNREVDEWARLRKLCAEHGVLTAYGSRIADMTRHEDRFVSGVDALVDERYAEEARERTERGHRTSVRNGTPRGFAGYGYRYVRDPHTGRLVGQERDPATAPVVEELVARILAGTSLYQIAKSLNERGVPTPMQRLDQWKGRDVARPGWSSSMIRNVLGKQSLMGIRTWHGQAMGPGAWEPIVPPDQWRRVQATFEQRRSTGHDTHARTLLSGIARCGVCSAWMRPLLNRGRPTYVCGGVTHTAPKGHVSRGREQLDAVVIRAVVTRLADPALLGDAARRRSGGEAKASAVAREIADLEAELAQYVLSASSRTGLARVAFEQVVDRLAAQIEQKRAELVQQAELPRAVLDAAGPDAAAVWASHDGDWEWRRQVVRSLVSVTVHPTRRRGVREFELDTIEIVPL